MDAICEPRSGPSNSHRTSTTSWRPRNQPGLLELVLDQEQARKTCRDGDEPREGRGQGATAGP